MFVGIIDALDEGSFLWAQRRADNISNSDKDNGVRPGRWTRSVFNWLHSPLINSIQEAFVPDSIYDNLPPVTRNVKRTILKNASDVNLEESFENEFFLWEDNEGNPLEFGLKQIQEARPCSQPIQDYKRFNRSQTDHLWEEPMVYEYNQDVKDVDINHLSYHEKYKLDDILKNKLHSSFFSVFSNKHTTKHRPSIYYTFEQSTKILSTANSQNGTCSTKKSSNQENFNNYQSLTSSPRNESGQSTVTGISSSKDASEKKWSSYKPSESKYRPPYYNFTPDSEGHMITKLKTPTTPKFQNLSSIDAEHFVSGNSKGVLVPFKPWLDFHEVTHDGEETPYFSKNDLNNHGPMKMYDTQKNVSNEAPNHRKLRTVHHKRFLKYRRKNKRKSNKLKCPEGHSCQYELFNGNFKSSG